MIFWYTVYRILQNVRKPSPSRQWEKPKWKSALVGWTENCLNLNNNKIAKRYKIMSSFRFHFDMFLFSYRSKVTSKCGKKIQWPSCLSLTSNLPHFDVICERTFTEQTHDKVESCKYLLNRCATAPEQVKTIEHL